MARPLEYNLEIVAKAEEYIKSCQDSFKILGEGESAKTVPTVKVPTIEGLAVYLNIHKDTIYDWESKFSEFSDVIATLRSHQADRLINNGLAGTYNPTIAKVLLTKHGYKEGTETDVTSKGEKIESIVPALLSEADKLLKEKKLNDVQ